MIHTQSNALVTSKIRARKTPKLIHSRVASNAIAGKPVPPEVRKKILLFIAFLRLFIPRRLREEEDFISSRGPFLSSSARALEERRTRRRASRVIYGWMWRLLCETKLNALFSFFKIIPHQIGPTFAVFVRNRTRPSRVRLGKVANARQVSDVRRRCLFSDRHRGCFG